MKNTKKAQGTFEYILLVAGVLVVLIVFLNPFGVFRYRVEYTLNSVTDLANNIVESINIR